jgi:hypothetical protein
LRTEIGRLFDQGHGVVLLILDGAEKAENARMESVARTVIAKAAAGKLSEDQAAGPTVAQPQSPAAGTAGDREPGAGPAVLRVGLLKFDRSKTTERWLLGMLKAMTPEPSKNKVSQEPVLFAIYGRGRAMPPGIGKEVTDESLTGLLCFLAGQCSCTIKDQNPGLDLLMRWDWEVAAEKFADDEQAAAPQPLYAEVSVDTAQIGGKERSDARRSAEPDAAAKAGAPSSSPDGGVAMAPAAPKAASAPQTVPSASNAPGATLSSAAQREPSTAESADNDIAYDAFAARQRWQLGIGLAGVAALVVAIGLVFMLRQRHGSP